MMATIKPIISNIQIHFPIIFQIFFNNLIHLSRVSHLSLNITICNNPINIRQITAIRIHNFITHILGYCQLYHP